MNPVLANTRDFNQYIQDRLNPKIASSQNRSIGSNPELKKSKIQNKEKDVGGIDSIDYARIIQSNVLEDNYFIQGTRPASAPKYNIKKLSENQSTKRFKDEKTNEFGINLVHSWKRHLNPPPAKANKDHDPIKISLPPRGDLANHGFEDEEDLEPRGFNLQPAINPSSPPGLYPPQQKSFLLSPTKRDKNLFLQISNDHQDESNEFFSFSPSSKHKNQRIELKLRVKVLQKCFAAWNQVIRHLAKLNLRNALLIQERTREFRLRRFLTEWFLLFRANRYLVAKLQRQQLHLFLTLRKRILQRKHQQRKSAQYYFFHRGHSFFQILQELVYQRRKHHQKYNQQRKASLYRVNTLLARVFGRWKFYIKQQLSEKALMMEQYQRKSKIQNFLERMRNPEPSLPKKQTESAPMHKGNESKMIGKTSSMNRGCSAGKTRPVPVSSGQSVQRKATSARSSTMSSHSAAAEHNRHSESENKRERQQSSPELIVEEEFMRKTRITAASEEKEEEAARRGTAVHSPSKKKRPEKAAAVAEELYVDDFEEMETDEAPPSYRQLFPSHREDKSSRSKAMRSPESFPREAAEAKETRAISTTVSISETPQERRERLALIRQQTFQRVRQRQEEESLKKREQDQREEQIAQKIREEAKTKRLEEKASSVRQITIQAEAKRQLQRAVSFHRQSLLIHYGFAPWIRYLERRRRQWEEAVEHSQHRLRRSYWNQWKEYYLVMKTERVRVDYKKTIKATLFYRKHLLRRLWKAWRSYGRELSSREKAVQCHYLRGSLIKRRYFGQWKIAFERSIRQEMIQLRGVQRRGERSLCRYYFQQWRQYHTEQQLDREIESRAEQRWNLVQSWLRK